MEKEYYNFSNDNVLLIKILIAGESLFSQNTALAQFCAHLQNKDEGSIQIKMVKSSDCAKCISRPTDVKC